LEISQIDGLYLFFVSFFFSFGQAGPDPGRPGGKVPGLKKLTGPGRARLFFDKISGPGPSRAFFWRKSRPGP
jgi:hypothetical protein